MEFGPEYYDSVYSKKSINYFRRYSDVYIYIMKHVNKNDVILDLGCGMGYFSACYLNGTCKDFLGIDFSNVGIQKAQQCFPLIKDKFINFNITDLDKLKYPYTRIICTEVFEHIDNDIEVISKIKSGTPIIFTVPANEIKLTKSHLRRYNHSIINTRYGELLKIESIEQIRHWYVVISSRR